jgi:microsomal dipeptidase-like Zn-dependent dipeptidase
MKMRKRFWLPPALLGLVATAFFGMVPGYVERSMNRIDGQPLIEVSDAAQALHQTLTIVDLHSDSLLWDRDINDRSGRGHVDVPRLAEGNVALQLFSSVTKTPKDQNYDSNSDQTDNITLLTIVQLQPLKTWGSLLERSLYHAQKLHAAVAAANGGLVVIDKAGQLDALIQSRHGSNRPVGALLTIEGLHILEGKAGNLDRLHAAGFRMAGLTHFFDNELGGSMHGITKGGLTPFGRDIVQRMEASGMIVDIAHLSHAGVAEVLAMATRPVVSSHGGVQATCEVNRNLTDDEIKGIARTGGVVGIGYWDAALCDTSPRAAAKAMKHVRDLVGIETVALGSDYDGATTVRFDTSQLVQVTQALLDEGFTPAEIRAAMGGNALRVIRAGVQPFSET